MIRAAAAELPRVGLQDATRVCVVLGDREPERLEAAAVRWIARYCRERPDVCLQDVEHATQALHPPWNYSSEQTDVRSLRPGVLRRARRSTQEAQQPGVTSRKGQTRRKSGRKVPGGWRENL